MPGYLLLFHLIFAAALGSARASGVNVNVGPLGDTHKHRWYVWLIVSVAGAAFLISLFWTIRGMIMWRRRVRALRTQRRAEALGVSPDKLPQDDVELGLFSFWDTDKLPLGRASSGKSGIGEAKRHSDLVSEASSKKLSHPEGAYAGRGRPLNRRLSACTGLVNTPALLNFSTTYAAWTPSDEIPSDGAAVIKTDS